MNLLTSSKLLFAVNTGGDSNNLVWLIVGVLAIIALFIFIIRR